MADMKTPRLRRVPDKLAVESESGLTTAQLMLTNYDLKPGELFNGTERQVNVTYWAHQLNPNGDNGVRGTL